MKIYKLLTAYCAENKPKNPLTFWVSTFICYFMVSIISIAICITAGPIGKLAVLLILIGFVVDVARWIFAPELKMTPYQRQMSFQRALDDPTYSLQCRNKFSQRTASIYWVWWLYALVMFSIYGFASVPVNTSVVRISAELYPFIRSPTLILQTFGLPTRAAFALQFLSITWFFMIAAMITEISGGAFYFFHKPIKGIVIGERVLTKTSHLGLFRVPLALFCIIVTYCMFGFTELNMVGVSHAESPIGVGHTVPTLAFVYIVVLNGVALLSTAGCVRALYGYILLTTTNVFPRQLSA